MQTYRSILDGMIPKDIKESESGYNYYGFIRHDGAWVIMRQTIATSEFEYAIGTSAYSTAIAGRAGLTYGDGQIS